MIWRRETWMTSNATIIRTIPTLIAEVKNAPQKTTPVISANVKT